jgi:hypothetical protein
LNKIRRGICRKRRPEILMAHLPTIAKQTLLQIKGRERERE